MQQVAEIAGVSKMAVSLALRNSPRLPASTRDRIRQLAKTMGYVPDPALRALATHKQQTKEPNRGEVIGVIIDGPEAEPWIKHPFLTNFRRGLQLGAEELGFRLEFFWAGDAPGKRLGRLLHARGINGLILFPEHVSRQRLPYEIDWEKFSVVRMGRTHRDLQLSCVTHDHYNAMRRALDELLQRGYQHPAFVQKKRIELRLDYRYAAAFNHFVQKFPDPQPIPVWLHADGDLREHEYQAFIARHHPDVILSTSSQFPDYRSKNPRGALSGIDYLGLDLQDNQPELSGINQNMPEVGRETIHLLDQLIRTNIRGLRKSEHTVALGGTWQEGSSLRKRPSKAHKMTDNPD